MNMITYGLSVLVLVVKVREWFCMNKDCVSSVSVCYLTVLVMSKTPL